MCQKLGYYLDWGLLLNQLQAIIQTDVECTLQTSTVVQLNLDIPI